MPDQDVVAVEAFGTLLREMLGRGKSTEEGRMVEPPMSISDIADLLGQFDSIFPDAASSIDLKKRSQYVVIETAIRDKFNNLLATTSIDSTDFVELWDLLDVISVLSDEEQCDPPLLFWLVEELLDSQTIAGCRKVFDYLESRRERITAKHFAQKNLVILRSCNELLRRLSRADDTAFCGRVFIFMFQSFPLGDKSSVNLRGEYHLENVTTFDIPENIPEKMEIDPDSNLKVEAPKDTLTVEVTSSPAKGVTFSKPEAPMSAKELYPVFWSMQQYFNQPKKLFDPANLNLFKTGLDATMTMFRSVQTEVRGPRPSEESRKDTKRKQSGGGEGDDLANSFNPKYLTSIDLFELEIQDLSFRRNILVQVLIIVEFLLSLSAKAKEKLSKSLPDNLNKSVMYSDQTLGEEDSKWAMETKRSIADYLKQGYEGPFFYRMVETVISRDKNWARWKIENCPSIAKPSITPEAFLESKAAAKKATTNKRLRPNPIGSLDLTFLADSQNRTGLDKLKTASRYQLPSVKSFQEKIDLDDMDIDMANSDETKNAALESKASKSWRALRIASTTNLAGFDKIERSDKIDEIFKDKAKTGDLANAEEDVLDGEEVRPLADRRPIVISGPSGVGKETLISKLLENHPKSFGKKISHNTRKPRAGEVHGKHYYFISKEEYDILRDGDEFLEFNNYNGNDYGTSIKVLQGIISQGKVPIMEMDYHGIQQLKDVDYSARFIFIAPPNLAELGQRLIKRGTDPEDKIKERLEIAKEELKQAEVEGFHNQVFVNEDLDATYKSLEDYIFGAEEADAAADTEMATGEEAGKADTSSATEMDVDGGAKR